MSRPHREAGRQPIRDGNRRAIPPQAARILSHNQQPKLMVPQMDTSIHIVPAALVDQYQGQSVIVRFNDCSKLAEHNPLLGSENVLYVQVNSLDAGPEVFNGWEAPFALELKMQDPATQFRQLYNFSNIVNKHPVRVSIPVKDGLFKAVKLALALGFAVKLEPGQPTPEQVEEMRRVLELYLHTPDVSQPVEFYHSIFLSFFNEQSNNLWLIQEEDPERFCFVTDEGVEGFSGRFDGIDIERVRTAFARNGNQKEDDARTECDSCQFLDCCAGYFKWPDSAYNCDGVKTLFSALRDGAMQLKSDLNSYTAACVQIEEIHP
jgi:hypothetical protein